MSHTHRIECHAVLQRMAAYATSVALAITIAACGGDSATVEETERQTTSQAGQTTANVTDLAFVSEMVPHHRSAVDMAEMAVERAEHDELRALAEEIVEAQTAEISTLERLQRRFEAAGVDTDDLGLSEDMAGMSMDAGVLETADPFDREFIDMMISHHQGAIRMARTQLENGADPEAKGIAEDVIAAQSREIEQLNEWRTAWYGAVSEAGGVPQEAGDSSGTRAGTEDSR